MLCLGWTESMAGEWLGYHSAPPHQLSLPLLTSQAAQRQSRLRLCGNWLSSGGRTVFLVHLNMWGHWGVPHSNIQGPQELDEANKVGESYCG